MLPGWHIACDIPLKHTNIASSTSRFLLTLTPWELLQRLLLGLTCISVFLFNYFIGGGRGGCWVLQICAIFPVKHCEATSLLYTKKGFSKVSVYTILHNLT